MSQTPLFPEYGAPISLDDAKKVALAAESYAKEKGWAMAIAVYDSSAQLKLVVKMDQAQHASVPVAQAKAESAVNFRRPTKIFEDAVAAGGLGLRMLNVGPASCVDGGLPLLRDGKVIGSIGVSGMQALQDAEAAAAGVKGLE